MEDQVVRATVQDSAPCAAGDQLAGLRKRAAAGLSKQQVPVLLSDGGRAYPGCARRLNVQREAVNVPAGVRGRGSCFIHTVNHRHRQRKSFLGPFRGARRTYLDSYLRWFQQGGLVREESPRSCLVASMVPICVRFAN